MKPSYTFKSTHSSFRFSLNGRARTITVYRAVRHSCIYEIFVHRYHFDSFSSFFDALSSLESKVSDYDSAYRFDALLHDSYCSSSSISVRFTHRKPSWF